MPNTNFSRKGIKNAHDEEKSATAPEGMQNMACQKGPVKFTEERLNLPLFMLSRNRFKINQPNIIQKNLEQKKDFYTSQCLKDTSKASNATRKRFEHVLGRYKPTNLCAAETFRTITPKTEERRWQLPPNTYDVSKEPYACKKGKEGAYIAKVHETKRRMPLVNQRRKFYKMPEETKGASCSHKITCASNKGVFLSNARTRPATERSLIMVKAFCTQDGNEPGPDKYYPKNFTMQGNLVKRVKTERFNPHNFYRYSSVPESFNHLSIPRHISFEPGPGRFESRYHCSCPCTRKGLPYMPEQERIIEREMRKKFRRLPYIKHLNHHVCSTEWRHIKGGGWRHLFKNIPPRHVYPLLNATKKPDKQLNMDADGRYYSIINNPPSRKVFSFRTEPLPKQPKRIVFNSTEKPKHGHVRMNRRIGFGSTSARFPGMERPRALTAAQVRELLARIPPERRLRDFPTMRVDPKSIRGKLDATPKYMAPVKIPKNKPQFKFQPKPVVKLLVKEEDIIQRVTDGYYNRQLDTKYYYKKEYKEREKLAETAVPSALGYVPEFTFGRLFKEKVITK